MAITTSKLIRTSAAALACVAALSRGCPVPSILTSIAESDVVVVATAMSYTRLEGHGCKAEFRVDRVLKGNLNVRPLEVAPVATSETGPLSTGANLMIAKDSEHILFLKRTEDGGAVYRPCGRMHVPLSAIPPYSVATDIGRGPAISWMSRLVKIRGLPEDRRYPEVHAFMSEAKGLFWDECADFVFHHHLRGYTGKTWMAPCSRWLQSEDEHLKAIAMLRLAHEPSSHAVTKPIAWGSDQYLQPIAVKALLRYEGEGAARLRMELAEHPQIQVRVRALGALGTQPSEDGVRAFLVSNTRAPEPEIRAAAIDALWYWFQRNDPGDLLPLVQAMQRDDDARVRQSAGRMLGRLGR
jgi:hypothetical protein